jgi:hypothetical protein
MNAEKLQEIPTFALADLTLEKVLDLFETTPVFKVTGIHIPAVNANDERTAQVGLAFPQQRFVVDGVIQQVFEHV